MACTSHDTIRRVVGSGGDCGGYSPPKLYVTGAQPPQTLKGQRLPGKYRTKKREVRTSYVLLRRVACHMPTHVHTCMVYMIMSYGPLFTFGELPFLLDGNWLADDHVYFTYFSVRSVLLGRFHLDVW